MSSFPARTQQIWRSSAAEQLRPISGVFEYEVLNTLMVAQTLDLLREWPLHEAPPAGRMQGFIRAMAHYMPPQNRLWYEMNFPDAKALFDINISTLYGLVRDLEILCDINFTVSKISFLADVGSGPNQPLMIVQRQPIARGVGFEVRERGQVRASLLAGDLALDDKLELAQQHYSTGATLLAVEDQLPGILDGAFVQFYLAMEAILESHQKDDAIQRGILLFGSSFDDNLQAITRHVYLARHRFFGHAHYKWQKGLLDERIAFQIAKQTLVARWCSRALIALGLGRKLVHREVRFYPNLSTSIEFTGDAATLLTEFTLPA